MRFFVWMMIGTLTSCREEAVDITIANGQYEGVFLRSSPTAKYRAINVQLTFQEGAYSGSSDESLPMICQGQYTIAGAVVSIDNTCANLADIGDYSLVFSGDYHAEVNGQQLTMIQQRGELTIFYNLTRKSN